MDGLLAYDFLKQLETLESINMIILVILPGIVHDIHHLIDSRSRILLEWKRSVL